MLFKKTRNLKDKIFSTTINFVDFGERDGLGAIDQTSKEKEQDLVDNFGAPKISVGKEFTGHALVEEGKVKLVEYTDGLKETCITFVLSDKELDVTTGFAAGIAVDAKKEKAVEGKLTAEQVAEAKCLIFEKEIEARLTAAIDGLKAKYTAFELEELEEIAIPVPSSINHVH